MRCPKCASITSTPTSTFWTSSSDSGLCEQDTVGSVRHRSAYIRQTGCSRILLLSAAPFKAYTGDSPWESGEEHYKEFRTILGFLFDGNDEAISGYEEHRQSLFKQLLELSPNSGEIDTSHRDAVQTILRRVMCRTERLSVSEDFNAMTVDKWQSHPLHLSAGDIQNFIATDNVVRYLNETDDNSKSPASFAGRVLQVRPVSAFVSG